MQEELSEMKTDIALIKANMKNIENFFSKVEGSLAIITDLSKKIAVQDEQLKNTVDKLEDVDRMVQDYRKEDLERSRIMMERLDDYRSSAYGDHQRLAEHTAAKRIEHNKMIIDEIREMKELMQTKFDEQDEKILELQRWKYYAMGAVGLAMFVIVEMNWQIVFG